MPTAVDAARTLGRYAGTGPLDRDDLVAAAVAAAQEEVLEALADGQPPYGTMADARAARLARVSRHFVARCAAGGRPGRLLRRREIQALFRVPGTTADSIDKRMRAMWPDIEDSLLRVEVKEGAQSVKHAGTSKQGQRVEAKFKSDAAYDAAASLLERADELGLMTPDRDHMKMSFPYSGKPERAEAERVVRDTLGLEIA